MRIRSKVRMAIYCGKYWHLTHSIPHSTEKENAQRRCSKSALDLGSFRAAAHVGESPLMAA